MKSAAHYIEPLPWSVVICMHPAVRSAVPPLAITITQQTPRRQYCQDNRIRLEQQKALLLGRCCGCLLKYPACAHFGSLLLL